MRFFIVVLMSIFLGGVSQLALAVDLYPFADQQKQQQFNSLIHELRCLVCQNESLAASNASLAVDLRNEVYQMVKQGTSSAAIKAYLVKRYGNFILFKPPMNRETYLLWLWPFLMLIFGFLFLIWIGIKQNKNRNDLHKLSDGDQSQLTEWLSK